MTDRTPPPPWPAAHRTPPPPEPVTGTIPPAPERGTGTSSSWPGGAGSSDASPRALACRDLEATYGDTAVLRDLHLDVTPGEVVAVLGVSGSGKTTLLSTIAGFHPVSAGTIDIAGRRVAGPGTDVAPEQRRVGVVFQHYALWPHLDAVDTVAYPLRRRGLSKADARARAMDHLDRLELGHLAHRRPAELSGGQQQRVGLARALASEPQLFLFDEPTSHLDATLRRALQDTIAEQRRELGASAVYATHDADEALAVAERVALLRDGRVDQLGHPEEVYARPVDLGAAQLTGPASVLAAQLRPTGDGAIEVELGGVSARVAVSQPDAPPPPVLPVAAALLVRPEWVTLGGPFPGRLERRWFRGPHTDLRLSTPAGDLLARVPGTVAPRVGTTVTWGLTHGWPVPGGTSSVRTHTPAHPAPR
jgi:iron(III) transport system ATP-binding protein